MSAHPGLQGRIRSGLGFIKDLNDRMIDRLASRVGGLPKPPGVNPTYHDIFTRAQMRRLEFEHKVRRHQSLQTMCRAGAAPLAWLAALFAGLSGLSTVQNNPTWGATLAFGTLLVSTLLAVLKPGEAAQMHAAAAVRFERLQHSLEAMTTFEVPDADANVPDDKLKTLRDEFDKIEQDGLKAEEESLPVGPEWFWSLVKPLRINPDAGVKQAPA